MTSTDLTVSAARTLIRSAVPPVVAALAVIIGAAMSWRVESSRFGSLSDTGLNVGDGKITLACAVIAVAAVGAATYFRWLPKLATVLGSLAALAVLGTGIYDTINGERHIHSSALLGAQHIGAGLWLTDAAALVLSALMVVATIRAFTGRTAFIDLVRHEPMASEATAPSAETIEIAKRAVRQLPAQRRSVNDSQLADQ